MSRNDLPKSDAIDLFSQRLICDDFGEWQHAIPVGQVQELSHGLLTPDGVASGAYVHLKCISNRGRKLPGRFMLSIFKYERGAARRAYQLDITQWPYLPATLHERPHEHVGDSERICGDITWCRWSFDDMIQRFCQTTNVTFRPSPPIDPTAFTLRP